MPEAYPDRVSSFTSEDKVYPASNLLKSSSFSKWQSEKGGTKQEAVELCFEQPVEICRLDIGNNGSAFVEVLVRRSASSDEPAVFLPSSSFMSPVDAKNGTNLNRVRVFSGDQFLSNVRNQKWDTFRFVCTQPFNKTLQYGLSFISFHSPAPANSPSRPPNVMVSASNSNFILEDDDSPDFQPGSLFRASKASGGRDQTDISVPKPASALPPIVRERIPHASPVANTKPHANPVSPATSRHIPSKNQKSQVAPTSSSSSSAPSTTVITTSSKPLNGVVFSLSGYQNPLRSELRRKALDLGASFRQNWGPDCTHLICAFANTPKFKEVKGKAIIISDKWIEECHKTRTKVNWRPYRVGRAPSPPALSVAPTIRNSEADDPESAGSSSETHSNVDKPLKRRKKDDDDEDWNPESSGSEDQSDEDIEADVDEEVDFETVEDNDSEDRRLRKSHRAKRKGDKLACSSQQSKVQRSHLKGEQLEPNEEDTDDEIERAIHSTSDNVIAPKSIEAPDEELCPPEPDNLIELPDIFDGKHFFLHTTDISADEDRLIRRLIVAFAGALHPYMHPDVEFVVTRSKWNAEFDEALQGNPSLIFVRPDWVFACDQQAKWVPYQKFLVVG